MYTPTKRFKRFQNTATGALIAASIMTLSSTTAMAAIIDSGVVNIAIPQTTAGVYLNFVTNAQGTSGAAVTGWDFNPYNSNSGTNLGIYTNPTTQGGIRGGGVASAAQPSQYQVLTAGTLVDGTSIFSSAIQATVPNFTAGVTDGYLGFRFVNEATSAINYGWIELTTTGPISGFPATIVRYVYDNTGAGITVGAPTPVQLQSFGVD
ncbi:MAG: hypothetical protein WBV39_13470 [Rudaea sp.]